MADTKDVATKGPDVTEPLGPGLSEQIHSGRPLVKYVTWFGIASVFLFMTYSAFMGILIPSQVQTINTAACDPSWVFGQATPPQCVELVKTGNAAAIGLITGVAAIFTTIAQPICGSISDRFRSRFGRRAPFLVIGAILGFAFTVGLRNANAISMILIFWVLVQISLNFMQAPLTTTIADRIPAERRGSVSAVSGVGTMVGGAFGAIVAGLLLASIGLNAYYLFTGATVVGALVFVIGAKDRSSRDLVLPHFSWKEFFVGFGRPLKDHDYRWVWLARFALILGYFGMANFNQQILQFYIKPALSQAQANITAGMLQVAALPFMLIGMLISGILSDKLGKRKPFVIGCSIGMAVMLVLPLVWPTMAAMWIYSCLVGMFFGSYMAIDQALFIDVLPNPAEAGKDLGVANVATNLGQAAGPLIGGALVAATSTYHSVYIWAILWAIIGGIAVIKVRKVA